MYEGRIAYDRDGLAGHDLFGAQQEAVDAGYRGAHAERGIQGIQRSRGAQCVAAYVAQHGDLVLDQRVVHASVRTSRAHYRRPCRSLGVCFYRGLGVQAECLGYGLLRELSEYGELFLSDRGKTELSAVVLYYRVQFLYDVESVDLGGEISYEFFGQRVWHAYLQHAYSVAEDLLYVLV